MAKQKNLLKIIEAAGLGADEKEKLIESFECLADERVLAALTNKLSDEDAKVLEEKLAGEIAPEEVIKFLQEKLPDFKAIVSQELEAVQKDIAEFLTKG